MLPFEITHPLAGKIIDLGESRLPSHLENAVLCIGVHLIGCPLISVDKQPTLQLENGRHG